MNAFLPPARHWLAWVLLSSAVWAASASAGTDPQVESAIQEFRTQAAGDSTAAAQTAEQLNQLVTRHASDPRLLAYAGAATARRATTTMLPWKKMGYAEDGLAQLDKALSLLKPEHDQPQDGGAAVALETRLVAANTFLALPGMFNRGARGEKLLGQVLQHPQLAASPAGFRSSAVFWLAGTHARKNDRIDEARRYFERVLALGSVEAVKAQAELQQLKGQTS